jgi:hypothetical protein
VAGTGWSTANHQYQTSHQGFRGSRTLTCSQPGTATWPPPAPAHPRSWKEVFAGFLKNANRQRLKRAKSMRPPVPAPGRLSDGKCSVPSGLRHLMPNCRPFELDRQHTDTMPSPCGKFHREFRHARTNWGKQLIFRKYRNQVVRPGCARHYFTGGPYGRQATQGLLSSQTAAAPLLHQGGRQ